MPAPARLDAGTASQPIPGVRRTADAKECTAHDPAVVAGVFNVTVHQWMVTSIKPLEATKR